MADFSTPFAAPSVPPFLKGDRVSCYSASNAGGLGTVESCDDRLVLVRLDRGPVFNFLHGAVTHLPVLDSAEEWAAFCASVDSQPTPPPATMFDIEERMAAVRAGQRALAAIPAGTSIPRAPRTEPLPRWATNRIAEESAIESAQARKVG